jgi:magnesium-transporting ATPase (P-type)
MKIGLFTYPALVINYIFIGMIFLFYGVLSLIKEIRNESKKEKSYKTSPNTYKWFVFTYFFIILSIFSKIFSYTGESALLVTGRYNMTDPNAPLFAFEQLTNETYHWGTTFLYIALISTAVFYQNIFINNPIGNYKFFFIITIFILVLQAIISLFNVIIFEYRADLIVRLFQVIILTNKNIRHSFT